MNIDIQARRFSLTDALREHTRRRLGFAFGTRQVDIQRITVRLSDINGPRGGADKQCNIQVVLPHLPDVVIEDIDKNMYVAIDRAITRASCTVARKLARQSNRKRAVPFALNLLPDEATVLS